MGAAGAGRGALAGFFFMKKVPVSLYFLTMSLAVEYLMPSLLDALLIGRFFSNTISINCSLLLW